MKRLRILALMHPTLVPPDTLEGHAPEEVNTWKTEYDIVSTLRGLGHDVRPLGVYDELAPIRAAIEEWKPHVVFNLLEEFQGQVVFDHHLVSYLELLGVPYTGCRPRGLVIARDKALSKKIALYHRIRAPGFAVFPSGRKAKRPARLSYPLIVKSLTEHASLGISQNSLVETDEELAKRVAFIHDRLATDAIVEEYIEGRELYVAVLGNRRLQALPVWELTFESLPASHAAIATERVKHDLKYQERWGIHQRPAADLPPALQQQLHHTSKRIYRALELDGYARIDFRLTADGRFYFLEGNPNPEIAESEEFAQSALAAGLSYPRLLERIVRLGLSRHRAREEA